MLQHRIPAGAGENGAGGVGREQEDPLPTRLIHPSPREKRGRWLFTLL